MLLSRLMPLSTSLVYSANLQIANRAIKFQCMDSTNKHVLAIDLPRIHAQVVRQQSNSLIVIAHKITGEKYCMRVPLMPLINITYEAGVFKAAWALQPFNDNRRMLRANFSNVITKVSSWDNKKSETQNCEVVNTYWDDASGKQARFSFQNDEIGVALWGRYDHAQITMIDLKVWTGSKVNSESITDICNVSKERFFDIDDKNMSTFIKIWNGMWGEGLSLGDPEPDLTALAKFLQVCMREKQEADKIKP